MTTGPPKVNPNALFFTGLLLRAVQLPLASQSASKRSEEHTSELQSQSNLVCRLLLEKKKNKSTSRCTPRSTFCACIPVTARPRSPRAVRNAGRVSKLPSRSVRVIQLRRADGENALQ